MAGSLGKPRCDVNRMDHGWPKSNCITAITNTCFWLTECRCWTLTPTAPLAMRRGTGFTNRRELTSPAMELRGCGHPRFLVNCGRSARMCCHPRCAVPAKESVAPIAPDKALDPVGMLQSKADNRWAVCSHSDASWLTPPGLERFSAHRAALAFVLVTNRVFNAQTHVPMTECV